MLNEVNDISKCPSDRINEACNSIRELIQSDVVQILKSGHKPQILALRSELAQYIKIIDEAKEDNEDAGQ